MQIGKFIARVKFEDIFPSNCHFWIHFLSHDWKYISDEIHRHSIDRLWKEIYQHFHLPSSAWAENVVTENPLSAPSWSCDAIDEANGISKMHLAAPFSLENLVDLLHWNVQKRKPICGAKLASNCHIYDWHLSNDRAHVVVSTILFTRAFRLSIDYSLKINKFIHKLSRNAGQ